MKFFKWLIAFVLFSIFGFYIGICYVRYNSLMDEYAYFLRTNNMLFDARGEGVENVRGEINKLLFLHFNRFTVYRNSMPKIFTDEIDELMCSSFVMSPDLFQEYKSKLDHDVYVYIDKHLDFCAFTLGGLANIDRVK